MAIIKTFPLGGSGGGEDPNAMYKGVDYVTAGISPGGTLGRKATAEGYETLPYGDYSHSEGERTSAEGDSAHSEGSYTSALGGASHAEGTSTSAVGIGTHTEGYKSYAYGNYAHAEGRSTTANGASAHAEGVRSSAIGEASHAEGHDTTAVEYAHAEGNLALANGNYAHAEGNATTAHGRHSHAEGDATIANADDAHAEGKQTTALGSRSHAEGLQTSAKGSTSHAEGYLTLAYGDKSHAEGEGSTAYAACSHAEGENTYARDTDAHAEGYGTTAHSSYSHAEGYETSAGSTGHAEGYRTCTYGEASHAEGYYTYASENYSHAEGNQTTAFGEGSHAEGYSTSAVGNYSHAEGVQTSAKEEGNHAEGYSTLAYGSYSHAEGNLTTAYGNNSHAGGFGTCAVADNSVAIGSFNDPSEDYAFVIGDGNSENNRSNLFTVAWDGTVEVNGQPIGGTVTNVATGVGLTGGPVTSTGIIKANLVSETASSLESESRTEVADREYPVGIDANNKLSVNVPWEAYESLEAEEEGVDVSLVTTGEKYEWNEKVDQEDIEGAKTATGNPITLADASETYAQELKVELEPIQQDLHGYDAPWPGGARKNKLPLTVDYIKSLNTGPWKGNSYSFGGVVYTLLTDDGNNVTGINVTGSSSGYSFLILDNNNGGNPLPYSGYTVSGCIDGSMSTYFLLVGTGLGSDDTICTDGDATITVSSSETNWGVAIFVVGSNIDTTFYPMIREASETDPTFEPYTNICPISGISECSVVSRKKNLFTDENYSNKKYINSSGTLSSSDFWNASDYILVPPNTQMYFQPNSASGSAPKHAFYDSNKTFISAIDSGACSFTTPSTCAYMRFSYQTISTNVQLELGSSATTYAPYKSTSATITLGQTVYGGNVDFLTGKCVVDKGYTSDWSNISFNLNREGTNAYEIYTRSLSKLKGTTNLISNALPVITPFSDTSEFSVRGDSVNSDIMFKFPKSVVNTVANGKQWLIDNNVTLCYELATPITIQLTPQELKLLQGNNTVTTNGYSISMKYQPTNALGEAISVSEEYTDRAIVNAAVDIEEAAKSDLTAIAEKTDTAPYIYRPSVANGDRVSEDIVGASVGWNQLIPTTVTSQTKYEVVYTSSGDGKIHVQGTATGGDSYCNIVSDNIEKGHKVLIKGCPSGGSKDTYYGRNGYIGTSARFDTGDGNIVEKGDDFVYQIAVKSGQAVNLDFYPQAIDLTVLFGATIAEYAYALEQATAGSGIAWLKSYGFFTKNYYPYNAGELLSVEVSGKKYNSKNLLDPLGNENTRVKTTNGITFIVNADGSITCNGTATAQARFYFKSDLVFPFDTIYSCGNSDSAKAYCYAGSVISSGKTITAGTSVGTNFIAVNNGVTVSNYTVKPMIRRADVTDATYEPYHLTTYTFPSQTLRGLFTLVDGELKANGDVYREDGTKEVVFEELDLGSFNWTYSSSGTFYSEQYFPQNDGNYNPILCAKYVTVTAAATTDMQDKQIRCYTKRLYVKDSAYTDATTFTNAMNGVKLISQKATPTTEQAEPLVMPQICDKNGTEEFITTSIVPVGHESTYYNYPDYMESGEYKDFRDRMDFAPELNKWKYIGDYENGDTVRFDKYYNEIMVSLHTNSSILDIKTYPFEYFGYKDLMLYYEEQPAYIETNGHVYIGQSHPAYFVEIYAR